MYTILLYLAIVNKLYVTVTFGWHYNNCFPLQNYDASMQSYPTKISRANESIVENKKKLAQRSQLFKINSDTFADLVHS